MRFGLRQRVAVASVVVVSALVAFQAVRRPAAATPAAPLTAYLPAGALLCLEAQDFGGLLDEWNRSGTKARWLASDNYRVYGNSNLFTKLGDLYGQYGAVAGVTPDLPGLRSMAGRESALALYRIREGEFVFITKLPAAAAARSVLGAKRASYAKREAAGLPFSVKLGEKTVAVAIAKGYFLVATREDLMAQALALLAGGQPSGGAAISGESWYQKAATAAGSARGVLRLSLDLPRLTATDGFRAYWVQRNGKELAQFGAGVADVFRTPNQIREERVLVRTEEAPRGVATQIGELARYVPAGCGFCQLQGAPSAEEVLTRWREKLLEPQSADSAAAPSSEDSEVAPPPPGADFENSLETAPPPRGRVTADLSALGKLLEDNPAVAILTAQQHGLAPDRVLVKLPVTVAVYGTHDWDPDAVRRAVAQATEIGWRPAAANTPGVWVQEGFGRLVLSVQGRLLAMGTDAAQLQTLAAQTTTTNAVEPTASTWTRLAVAQELPLYSRLTKALEPANAEPPFFSANLLSFVRALGALQTVTVVERESAAERRESVTYAWR